MSPHLRVLVTAVLIGSIAVAVAAQVRSPGVRLVVRQDWAGRGTWLRADTHVHTKFSDGSNSAEEVAEQAARNGCQAIAITDHASGITSDGYIAAIRSVRASRPDLTVIAGMEWNVPPYGSREHVSVLVPEHPGEGAMLAEFKRRFDDYQRKDGLQPRAEDGLAWLAQASKALPTKPVAVYNHPSRKDDSSLENVDDIVKWRASSDLLVGIEGAPGHQGHLPVYDGKERAIDRWDPVVARAGDAWDRLLQRGLDIHGAVASSDFHNANPGDLNDFWPCQFAETWFYVPERTTAGVLRAMRAGAFFGVHGHIARNVELTVSATGLPRAARAGEAIDAPTGTPLTVSVSLLVPETDWEGHPNHVDAVEFITLTSGDVAVQSHDVTGTGMRTISQTVTLGKEDLVIRARGRRALPDGSGLMFYTNAIRVRPAH